MNLNDYHDIFSAATEAATDDDIELGSIDGAVESADISEPETEMDILLEALDALSDDEFFAAMESMTEDEIGVIYQSALEASGNGGNNGGNNGGKDDDKRKPKHDASDAAIGTADDYKKALNGNHVTGGILGRISDYIVKKGQASIGTDMLKKIQQTGEKTGKDDVTRMAMLTKHKLDKDAGVRGLAVDAKTTKRALFNEMRKSGIWDPRAYLAANRQFNTAASNAYKDVTDAKLKEKLKKEADDKAKADFAKKHPEQAAEIKLGEKRKSEDSKTDAYRKTLSPEDQKRFDAFNTRLIERSRDDIKARAQKDYDAYKAMGYSDKAAQRASRINVIDRQLNNRIDDQNFKAGIKTAAGAFVKTLDRDTKSLQNGAKTVGKGVKKFGKAVGSGAKEVWRSLTASTGTELGFECHDEMDIDVLLESVYESGEAETTYTEALEEVYEIACAIDALNENEFDEFMSDMTDMEALEFVDALNYISDVIDADMRRSQRIAFESAVEESFAADCGYDVVTESDQNNQNGQNGQNGGNNGGNGQNGNGQGNNGSNNNQLQPANNNNQNQKPTIGERVKKFFARDPNHGLVEKVGGVVKKVAGNVRSYLFGPSKTPATNTNTNNGNNTHTQSSDSDNSTGGG